MSLSRLCLGGFILLLPLLAYLAWLGLVEEQSAPGWRASTLLKEPEYSLVQAEAGIFSALLLKEYLRAPGRSAGASAKPIPGPEDFFSEKLRYFYGILRPQSYAMLWKGDKVLCAPLVPDLESASLKLSGSGFGEVDDFNLGGALSGQAAKGGGHLFFSGPGSAAGFSAGASGFSDQSQGRKHYVAYVIVFPAVTGGQEAMFLSTWRELDGRENALLLKNIFYSSQFRYAAVLMAGCLFLLSLLLRLWPARAS